MLREWIIFALCLGVGGHVALGVMLHAPDLWPWSAAGFYGLLSGLLVYAVVQSGRLIWRMTHRESQTRSKEGPDPFSW
jgi:hypothetical protein